MAYRRAMRLIAICCVLVGASLIGKADDKQAQDKQSFQGTIYNLDPPEPAPYIPPPAEPEEPTSEIKPTAPAVPVIPGAVQAQAAPVAPSVANPEHYWRMHAAALSLAQRSSYVPVSPRSEASANRGNTLSCGALAISARSRLSRVKLKSNARLEVSCQLA